MPKPRKGTILENASREDIILDEWTHFREFVSFEEFAHHVGLSMAAWERLYVDRAAAGDGRATGRTAPPAPGGIGVRTGSLRMPGTHR
jgi:hypothetical protein